MLLALLEFRVVQATRRMVCLHRTIHELHGPLLPKMNKKLREIKLFLRRTQGKPNQNVANITFINFSIFLTKVFTKDVDIDWKGWQIIEIFDRILVTQFAD